MAGNTTDPEEIRKLIENIRSVSPEELLQKDAVPKRKEAGLSSVAGDLWSTGAESAKPEAAGKEKTAETEKEPEEDPIKELDSLVGLTEIKKEVKDLTNLVKVQQMRREKGLQEVPVSLHLVFAGNPGTGKTTVARILARIYRQIGVLSKGQLVEVDRSQLVAGYMGQTAIQTSKKIEEAMGGILFIDEAYTLTRDRDDDFGQEAVDTILKAMEDHREDFVVIAAGYTDLMKKFINSNPGLRSRFSRYMIFPDYTADELMQIFSSMCEKYQYSMSPEAQAAVREKVSAMEKNKGENFANARDVRNLFERIITNQASRIAGSPQSDLQLILPEDLGEGKK